MLNHGRFDDERYYLDTKLYPLNLEDYMISNFKSVVGISKYLRLSRMSFNVGHYKPDRPWTRTPSLLQRTSEI